MTWIARSTLALALAASIALLLSGPGTSVGLWAYPVGFGLLQIAAYAGIAAAALSVLQLSIPRLRKGRAALLGIALAMGAASAAPPLEFRRQAGKVPRINDISTDFANPAFSEQQRGAYPDIQPFQLAEPAAKAFARALAAGEAMGWEIVSKDTAAGRFGAVATTRWFGFKDDIEVRVTPEGPGSRVDIRSRSRVGRSDIGANAARIRAYFERLK